jgi:hypothetical protein
MLTILFALLVAAAANMQSETLRETARRVGPFAREIGCECVKVPIEQMISQADIVLVGTVAASSSRLVNGETDIYTDHVIQPNQVIAQRPGLLSGKPGETSQIVVEQHGGTVQIEGVQVSVNVTYVPMLKPGTRVLLILKRTETGKYAVVADYGAFRVDGEKLRVTSKKHLYPEYEGASMAGVTAELRGLAGRLWAAKK